MYLHKHLAILSGNLAKGHSGFQKKIQTWNSHCVLEEKEALQLQTPIQFFVQCFSSQLISPLRGELNVMAIVDRIPHCYVR